MASRLYEKMERKALTMMKDMRRTITAGMSGCVTVSLNSSSFVRAMYAPKPLTPATKHTPNQFKIEPIVFSQPNLATFNKMSAKAFHAALQKKVLASAT